MRVAQMGDLHQGINYPGPNPFSRFEDINRILDWTADRIIAEKVDLCLIAGDCFKDARVMLDRASQEIASILKFFRKLTEARIDVIVISGTPSHDSVAAYELLKDMKIDIEGNCRIHTIPGIRPYHSHSGEEAFIALLPGLNRSALLTQDEYKGLPPEQVHRIMTDKITQLCMGMSAQMPDDKPKILMAHMTYQGAETGFTDLLMQHEPILTREAVSGFDLVCLGHIHRPQVIDGKVFYSGPIERLSFNEQDIHPGFWIHEINADKVINTPLSEYKPDLDGKTGFLKASSRQLPNHYMEFISEFMETPARKLMTLNLDEWYMKRIIERGSVNWLFENDPDSPWFPPVRDKIIRLHYSCSEEVAKQLNRKQIEKSLYDAGAFFVTEIKADITRVDRARDSEVTESLGPVDALAKWCDNQGIDPEGRRVLQAMTAELLEVL